MDQRIQRIVLETQELRITGDLHLPREGYRSRLSDYLNRGDERFVPLANVEVRPLNADSSVDHHEFLAVAMAHVTLAYPEAGR